MSKTAHTITGNPAVLKKVNQARVLHELRFVGPASRAELARRTGLDAKTLTNLTASLLEQGLVVREAVVTAGRGRPAETIAINPDAALGLGVDVGAQQVTGAVVDLAGGVRHQVRVEYDAPKTGRALLRQAQTVVRQLLAAVGPGADKAVQGLGLCVPGFLDRRRGVVLESVNIRGLRDTAIVAAFERTFGRPVILEESSRTMALAELWFGADRPGGHFLCVDLGVGIGMGIVHHGVLYRGARERSGEIGHTVVEPRGTACHCGKRGCLETVASGMALARAAAAKGRRSGRELSEAAAAGDRSAQAILGQAGEYIGLAVANVIHLFDPDLVILNGGLVGAGDFLVEPLRRAVRRHAMRAFGADCPVRVSRLGKPAGAMGAGWLPLQKFFEYESIRFWH